MSMQTTLYEQDFYAWTQEQAARLEGRHFDALDMPYLVEEGDIQQLWASHHEMLRRLGLGESPEMIAAALGVTAHTVINFRDSSLVQVRLKELAARRDEEGLDDGHRL